MTEKTLPVSPTLRAKILAQARYRCGYCLTQQIAVNWLLEVEHIIPTAAGGSDGQRGISSGQGLGTSPTVRMAYLWARIAGSVRSRLYSESHVP